MCDAAYAVALALSHYKGMKIGLIKSFNSSCFVSLWQACHVGKKAKASLIC